MKFRRKQEIDVEIENVAFGGQGIARVNDFVVFVENTVPGDRVKARIRRVKKNFAEAYPLEILSPSVHRISPRCGHFPYCGGCKWQNLPYELQLQYKKAYVQDALQRIGKIEPEQLHEVLPSPEIFGYRNKMEFSFSDNRWLTPEELADPEQKKGFALGLHVPGSFDRVIDIEYCWLQTDLMNRVLHLSKEFFREKGVPVYNTRTQEGLLRYLVIRQAHASGEVMVNVVTARFLEDVLQEYAAFLAAQVPQVVSILNNVNRRSGQTAFGQEEKLIYGKPTIQEKLANFRFEISANSFFQTNTRGAEQLYRIVRDYARIQNEVVWDLYCGTGSISIFVSPHARQVVGFELVESAIQDAQRNARLNGVTNCHFIAGDLRHTIHQENLEKPDVVICDPPRAGMHPRVVQQLVRLAPPRIVYVSCNPTTMARDLAQLKSRYRLLEVQPVDMFPHTYHIESVARLELR